MSTIRGELRLLKTNVCQAEGIETLDSLQDIYHLDELWDRHFQMLLDASRGYGLGGESTFPGDLVSILENTIQSDGFRVNHLIRVVASVGGVDKLMEFMGGQEGFNLWLNSLDIHRQKRNRIRNAIQQLIGIANSFKETSVQIDVLRDLEDWIKK